MPTLRYTDDDDDELMLNVLRCQLTYQGQVVTNAEARFNKSLRPRKPEGSLGRTAQDVHLDSHTAPELYALHPQAWTYIYRSMPESSYRVQSPGFSKIVY